MKAIAIHQFGGVEELKLVDLPKPQPSDTELLIEIEYAGVNPVDWKIRKGFLKDRGLPHQFPLIPGWDAAGRVVALGRKVTDFKVGEKVYAYCRKPVVQWGAYAEYIALESDVVARMPKNISFAEAAAIPLSGLTAWQSLFDFAALKKGETVLIHAGAGGVGGYAIQFAKQVGAKVYTTATAKHHSYLKELGADVVIDYTQQNFVETMRRLEPQRVDVVFDTVGGEVRTQSAPLLKDGGRLVSILDQPVPGEFPNIRTGYVFVSPSGRQLTEIARLVEQGEVKPLHLTVMNLEQAAQAHRISESRHLQGKIVLKIKKSPL